MREIFGMGRCKWMPVCLLLMTSLAAGAQYTKEFKRIFFDAETLYQTDFYGEALSRYKNLLTLDPGNSNILFHCGACCLNIPGREKEAITYLQEASTGVVQSYKERSHKEAGAPVITYFMLGRAYHLDNRFDKAIEYYRLYRDAGVDEDPLQLEYAGMQVEACNRAREVIGNPPSFEFKSVLDQFDEDLPSSHNPVISGDGNILIFMVDYPADKKIMMTTRDTSGYWSRPRVINSEIGMVGETYPVCLSYDGKDLYLAHHYYSHSDIYVSEYLNGRWTEAEPLGRHVNGRTSETHASVSKDGKTLYFTSDQRGGEGSFDIYVSRLDSKGEWDQPSNLGPVINTPYEEHTPFISSNDSILFFSSQGHGSIGGIDVFFSEKQADGSWGEPENIGYPVNTTGEDLFFNPGWDEVDGVYAIRRTDDPTSNTINMVIELEQEELAATPDTLPEIDLSDTAAQVAAAPTIAQAIEPEETDEIESILNRRPDETENRREAGPAPPNVLFTGIPFEHNSYEINMAGKLEMEKIADLMAASPATQIVLTGHADATGSSDYNLILSLKRADQVARHLEERGIDAARIEVRGVGDRVPVARNSNPDGSDAPLGRYLNRQVYARITGDLPASAELSGVYIPSALRPLEEQSADAASKSTLTIQVMADTGPVSTSEFRDLDGVTEHVCNDGYYRYTCGTYRTIREAEKALERLAGSGFPGAFIRTTAWYEKVK